MGGAGVSGATFHLDNLHYSNSPLGHPAWTTFPLRCQSEIACWQSNQWKRARVRKCHFCPHLSKLVVFSLCPHPERSRSSRPIQKCPIIIDLSVVIFINNSACDDPAGMLMSAKLELIILTISPWPSAWLSDVHSGALLFASGPADDKMAQLSHSVQTWGLIKESASPGKSVIFSSKFMSACFNTLDSPYNLFT